MDPLEYLRGIRRRWPVIVATVAVALAIAWFTTTGPTQLGTGPRIETYEATTILVNTGGGSRLVNLRTIAFLASIPEVSQRVAEAVEFEGDPAQLGQRVQAVSEVNTGLLSITATSSDPEEATLLADTFAQELLGWLSEMEQQTVAAEAEALDKQLGRLERAISRLDRQIARTVDPVQLDLLRAERNARVGTYGALANQKQQSALAAIDPLGFVIIQPAIPELLLSPAGTFEAPRSRRSRLVLATIFGLAVGTALALILERFDTRIRTKEAAERHFGLPVLGEIPFIPRRKRKGMTVTRQTRKGVTVVTRARRQVPVVAPMPIVEDAFRLLGAGVMQAPILNGNGREWSHAEATVQPPKTILVTSPGPSDGKTTVVANLANSLAHVGKSVLIVSCDFRHPRIHDLFGIPNNGGLGAALASANGQKATLTGHIKQTPIPGVRVITTGTPQEHPAELLSSERMRDALAQARGEADVVLVDTAPVLASADATHLFPLVDAVLVVARAKRTTAELAERTSELLKRLRAPVVGVALNGATEVPMPRRYYRYFRE